jgi:hypothetical protein
VQSLPQVPQLWMSSGTQTPLHTRPEHPWLPSPPSKGATSAVASVAASPPASGAEKTSLFVVASPGADPSGPDASFVFGGVRSWMPRHPAIDAVADKMAIEARIVRNKVRMGKAPRCARGDVTRDAQRCKETTVPSARTGGYPRRSRAGYPRASSTGRLATPWVRCATSRRRRWQPGHS